MAQQGMVFTDAHTTSSVCTPTRYGILTGRYNWRSPLKKGVLSGTSSGLIPKDRTTVASFLKSQGYQTAFIGKWHLGEDEKFWPENQGFDVNIGGHSGGSPKANGGGGYFSPYNNPRLENGIEGEYLTNRLADEAVKYINQNKDSTFFLNFWLYNVHTPLQANASKIEKYKRLVNDSLHHSNAVYAAMVEAMDQVIGKIAKEVKESGIEDNTIIIFTADNGGLSTNSAPTSNLPLKGGKGWVYEGGIREPMFVVWPGVAASNSTCNEPVVTTDFYKRSNCKLINHQQERERERERERNMSYVYSKLIK